MYVLYGLEFLKNNDLKNAEKAFEKGINMPKSYGEAKTFFNQEAHIYYFLGITYERMGEPEKAKKAFDQATVFKAAISEISLFRALAFRKVNEYTNAREVLEEMLEKADDFIENKDRRSYYGVGSPSPMPFEYDIEKQNLTDGDILKAYALLGLGKFEEAESYAKKAENLDKYDFRIYAYKQILKGEEVCKDTL